MTEPDRDELTENPRIPEGINVRPHSVFRELVLLTSAIVVGFVLVAILLWHSLGFLARFIPVQWEARLTESVGVNTLSRTDDERELQSRVDGLLMLLEESDWPVTVHLLETSEVNAFATLGSHIIVTRGLLDALNTEAGLDFVLLHELAHLLNRDPIRAAAGQLGVRLLTALLTGQGDLPAPTLWLQSSERLLALHYSRAQEREADQLALNTLWQLYDDISSADELFVFLDEQGDSLRVPQIFSTHPHSQSRIEFIRSFIEEKS